MVNFEKIFDTNKIDPDKPMFPISIVADILKVHSRTLRIYDNEGLLIPPRSLANRRLYSFNDIERGKFIQYLTRELGINLAGIKIIFYLLKQQNIQPDKYIDHISKIAHELSISSEIQEENRIKFSRRGRKFKSSEYQE